MPRQRHRTYAFIAADSHQPCAPPSYLSLWASRTFRIGRGIAQATQTLTAGNTAGSMAVHSRPVTLWSAVTASFEAPKRFMHVRRDATHYVMPDAAAVVAWLELLEQPEMGGFVLLTSVLKQARDRHHDTQAWLHAGQVTSHCMSALLCGNLELTEGILRDAILPEALDYY